MEALIVGAIALNCYAVALIVARALVYRTALYRPMLWNVFLSVLPILVLLIALVSFAAVAVSLGHAAGLALLIVLGVVWLLILPNSSYLITELNLSHRAKGEERVPLWFDIILVITLAMSGVANTVMNVFIAHVLYTSTTGGDEASQLLTWHAIAAVAVVMLLLGLGMYLGRYLRLNSWDVRHPIAFAKKVFAHFRNAANVWACIGFSVTYALFLGIIYLLMVGPIILSLIEIERIRL